MSPTCLLFRYIKDIAKAYSISSMHDMTLYNVNIPRLIDNSKSCFSV